jgi:hypothetical protein
MKTTKAEKAEIKKQVQKIIFRAKVRSALEEFYAEVEGQNEKKPAYTPNPDGLITFRSLHF